MPATQTAASAPEHARWHVRLLGAVQASDGQHLLERFPSRAAAALLARLALQPQRDHAREELVELLWPGVALDVGRNRLRQTLSSLKSLLEADGAPVIHADRQSVRAVPGTLACDALQFEHALRSGQAARAAALYRGELMPGFYDDWIAEERLRLEALHGRIGDVPMPAAVAGPAPATAALPDAATEAPLPVYLTRLFGTEPAATRLAAAVRAERLVTLLGPGGSGKTRLAVQVAGALRGAPFARVVFVPLVAVTDAAGLRAALARALRLGAGRDDTDLLADALAGRHALLLLDNFEQLVASGAPLVAELLGRLPQLHLLVTSRRALALDGEHCVGAEPLALPADAAHAAASPAVALFVDRARAARADFHLHDGNTADVVRLVRALDGLPLAIELAASRVRAFAPGEMAARLAEGAALPLLARSGPRAGHDSRHASMEQVVDWSWRLLSPAEQGVLAALVVFEGDAAAPAVADVAGVADAALLLDALVGHSLVRALAAADGSPRFGLYEPVREFVAARSDLPGLRTRWRAWLLRWVRALGPLPLPRQVAVELPQVHAAIPSAVADGEPAQALALALALRAYWDTDAMPPRCIAALEAALPAAADASAAHELMAYLQFEGGDAARARAHADTALALAGDDGARARALVRRAWWALAAGRTGEAGAAQAELEASLEEAMTLARRCGDRETEARALHQMAVMVSMDQPERGLVLLERSQALWLALGDRRKAFARLRNRAQLWSRLGRHDEALASLQDCEAAAREDGDWVGLMDCSLSMASQAGNLRRWPAALEAGRRSVALCWQRMQLHGLGYALWNLPRPLAHLRDPERATRLMAFTARFWEQRFGPLAPADRHYVRTVQRLVQVQCGRARWDAWWIDGAALAPADAVALALAD